ncbi:MAG: hypothetical protein AB7O74_04380 [Candidatus Nanopelagicales bacterium]
MAVQHLDVWLERGRTRTFAIAPAWPGWARSARTKDGDEAAIEALLSYAPRYAVVADRAGLVLPAGLEPRVVGEVPGTATTDFGATDVRLPSDEPGASPQRDLERQVAIVQAAWDLFDETVDAAPDELAKGPRGGGRDTREIERHVVEAERSYVRKVGVRAKPYDVHDRALRDAVRADVVAAYLADDPDFGWPARYAIRRGTWHVLDHLWEIQDKS